MSIVHQGVDTDSSKRWKLAAVRELQELLRLVLAKKLSGNIVVNINISNGLATDARSSLNKNLSPD